MENNIEARLKRVERALHDTNDWAHKTERQLRMISLVCAIAVLVGGGAILKIIIDAIS